MIRPRICKICGNPIHLVEEREDVVWFQNRFAHKSCYINYYATKKCPLSEEKIRAFLPSVFLPAQEKIDELISADEIRQEQNRIKEEKRKIKEDKQRKRCEMQLQKQSEAKEKERIQCEKEKQRQEKERIKLEQKKINLEKEKQRIEEAANKQEMLKKRDEEKRIAKALANVEKEKRIAFFDFIRDTYAPAVVPHRFYIKLQRYVYGTEPTYKGNIPPEYFHDMWQRMLPKLNEIDTNNRAHGKVIDNRWDYDLAIVLRRYPSYLAWRQKQELQAKAIMDFHPPGENPAYAHCDAQNSAVFTNHTAQNTDEIDISSMLDEI